MVNVSDIPRRFGGVGVGLVGELASLCNIGVVHGCGGEVYGCLAAKKDE